MGWFLYFFFSSVLFSCFGTSLTKPLLWFAKNEFDFFTLILLDSSWDQTQILGIAVTYTGLPVSKKQQPGYVSLLLYMYYSSTYQPLARNKIYGYSAMPMVLSLNPALAGKVLTSWWEPTKGYQTQGDKGDVESRWKEKASLWSL